MTTERFDFCPEVSSKRGFTAKVAICSRIIAPTVSIFEIKFFNFSILLRTFRRRGRRLSQSPPAGSVVSRSKNSMSARLLFA